MNNTVKNTSENVYNNIKLKTKQKNTIERHKIIGELSRIKQLSEGMYKLIKINEIKIIKNGVIYKNVLDLYLKSESIPILWKNHIMKIANERGDRHVRTKRSNQHCREVHFFLYINR